MAETNNNQDGNPQADMDFAQEYRIRSSWTVRAAAGEPFAAVRVRNLQAVVAAAHDAWGREDRAQPALVSADVSFGRPFAAASADDRLGPDTVHYGSLSKAILASLAPLAPGAARPASPAGAGGGRLPLNGGGGGGGSGGRSLRYVLESVWTGLTGRHVDGLPSKDAAGDRPILDLAVVRMLSVTVHLPKASVVGEGVSLTASALFNHGADGSAPVEMFGLSLRLHNLRVPVLIGVNSNERTSKQSVVANVEIDKFDYKHDVYTALESLVLKSLEQSSFETLEALGSHVAGKIISDFNPLPGQKYTGYLGWQVKITLEKPIAVTFADAPIVEIRAGADLPQTRMLPINPKP